MALASLLRDLVRSQPCVTHGCDRPMHAKGVCEMHYQRSRVHGSYARPVRLRAPYVEPAEKRCTSCDEVKQAAAFERVSPPKRGLRSQCRPCRSDYHRERNYRLRGKYGISNEGYLEMVEAQGGLCAICQTDGAHNQHHGKLYVDHDHATGVVRGLLCHGCNVALGFMSDDPERLVAAAVYLRGA